MKKKSKIILGGCIVVAALIGLSVWNTWFSATKIAFVNFQTIQQGSISKANDNSFIKLSEVSLDNLDRLTSYDMVFINGMGLRIVEEQRQQRQQIRVSPYTPLWLPTLPITSATSTVYSRISYAAI